MSLTSPVTQLPGAQDVGVLEFTVSNPGSPVTLSGVVLDAMGSGNQITAVNLLGGGMAGTALVSKPYASGVVTLGGGPLTVMTGTVTYGVSYDFQANSTTGTYGVSLVGLNGRDDTGQVVQVSVGNLPVTGVQVVIATATPTVTNTTTWTPTATWTHTATSTSTSTTTFTSTATFTPTYTVTSTYTSTESLTPTSTSTPTATFTTTSTLTVTPTVGLALSWINQPTSAFYFFNQPNVSSLQFILTSTAQENVLVKQLVFTGGGGVNPLNWAGDVAAGSARLYQDASGTGIYSNSSDTELMGGGSFNTAGSVTFQNPNGITPPLVSGAPRPSCWCST